MLWYVFMRWSKYIEPDIHIPLCRTFMGCHRDRMSVPSPLSAYGLFDLFALDGCGWTDSTSVITFLFEMFLQQYQQSSEIVGTNSERSAMILAYISNALHLLVQLIFYLVLMKDDALLFLVLLLSLSNLNISSRRNDSNESNECRYVWTQMNRLLWLSTY